ncbi:MAG: 2Fe-2S iron-sulfur cluster-binding protein [Rhodothalassiaceae bacterium]
MGFTVRIKGHDAPVTVEMGRSILDSAIDQGGPFPYSCRAGNCGTCKCRLLSGEIEMSPFSEFALSPEEQEKGFILACRAVPWSDCEIELAGEDDLVVHPMRDMRAELVGLSELTHDIRRLELAIIEGGPFIFSAGQYAELSLGTVPARSWSMASLPDAAHLVFYVRLVPGGQASRYIAQSLEIGDIVRVRGPFGSAYLREGRRAPLIAIAGGSGLAPIRAIVDRALALGWSEAIHVYFGVRDERDLFDLDHFEELAARHANLRFEAVLSDPSGPTARRTGFVTDAVRADFPTLEGHVAYLAGPPPMIEAAERLLARLGIEARDIHADAFYTEAEKAKGEAS